MMADRLLAAFLHYFGRPRKIAPRCRAHAQPALGCRAAAELSLAFNRSARDRTLLFKWLLPLQGFTDQAMRMVEHYIDGARSIGDAPSFYSVLGREPADSLFTCNFEAAERFGQRRSTVVGTAGGQTTDGPLDRNGTMASPFLTR